MSEEQETLGTPFVRVLFPQHGKAGRYGLTSKGRKLVVVAIDTPKKGDIFLKPSGIRNVYNVHTATQDHQRSKHRNNYRMICWEKA